MGSPAVHSLELDLDVFAGPFDLLLSLILREELDLLEVELAEIVLAYVEHLEAGAEKARAIAVGTLADVREVMGVGPARRSVGPAA